MGIVLLKTFPTADSRLAAQDSFGMVYYAEFYNVKHSKCETGSSAPKHLLMRKTLTP